MPSHYNSNDHASNCPPQFKASDQVNPKFVPVAFGTLTGGAPTTFSATSQEPVYLKFALLQGTGGGGVVNDLTVGNQSLNCSDSDMDLAAFGSLNGRKPFIGLAVDGNIQVSMTVTIDGTGAGEEFQAGLSCEAIDRAPSIAEQGSAINKFFGLGSVSVPAKSGDVNGSAELSAQSLRGGILIKNIMLHKHGETTTIASNGIIVKDITIKGRSIFSGQASDGVGLNVLNSFVAAGEVGINIPMDTNERIIVKLENTTAGAVTVGGCAFCE
jgi:hypothetical protein